MEASPLDMKEVPGSAAAALTLRTMASSAGAQQAPELLR